MSEAFDKFKIVTLLNFRANYRAQGRPAATLEAETAELEARLDAIRKTPENKGQLR